jgi:chromosomal replication initiator protein
MIDPPPLQTDPARQAKDAFGKAAEHTRGRSPTSFDQWFSGVQLDGIDGRVLLLAARDEFVRDWVRDHFLPDLLESFRSLLGEDNGAIEVRWRIAPDILNPVSDARVPPASQSEVPRRPSRPPEQGAPRMRSTAPSRASLAEALNPKHTFSNFVVGPSNELAYAAALASAAGGRPRYNPLFIAGGTGLGKTHLMHAIAHRVLEERPETRIVYLSAEHFTNAFIEALQHHKMDEFRARYRVQCDLLLVDDIQFLAGREQTQEEFFHTFNALHDADRLIVVTSDKYPQQLQRMPERLVSRFGSGLVADIQVPQLETRVAIVRKKAELEAIPLSDEVAVLLAQGIPSNVRELEGALIRLAAKASLTGRPIDAEFVRAEMALVAPRRPDMMSVEDIQKAVCSHFRLSNSELLSKDRHKSVAFARQVAMYVCRQRLKSSFPELGRAFGTRDHTTVMSAVKRVEALRQRDPQVNAHLEAIEQKLASSDE